MGFTASEGAAVMVSVTGAVCGLLDAPAELTVIVPWYVAGANPAGLTETVRTPGVVPEGVTLSQPPPDCVDAAAV